MARLASDTKMGFYPTNINTIKKVIDKTINFPESKTVFALDCCAGEGEAIEFIGKEYKCRTFAVELDKNRAKIAYERDIAKVLNADSINGIRKNNSWVGLNFLNPPYGVDNTGNRLELNFIQRWGLTTAIGGVLLLVINPSSINEDMIRELRIQGYKPIISFYDENNQDYKKFGQFFIILQKQLPNYRAETENFISTFNNPLNIDDDIDFEKISIKTGVEPQLFKEIEIPRWKIEENLSKSKLKKVFFDELRKANLLTSSIEHPNEGQSAILIASGALNKEVTLNNKERVILKGTSNKIKNNVEQSDDDGKVDKVKIIDSYKTVIYGLNLSRGEFVKYE